MLTLNRCSDVLKPIPAYRRVLRTKILFVDVLYTNMIIIILSCFTSLDSSEPIQKSISVNREGLGTLITTK